MAASVFSNVVETFAAGKRPSYEDLKTAFHFAIAEIQRISENANELSAWVGRIIEAHLDGDQKRLRETLCAFVEKHCEIVDGVPALPSGHNLLEEVAKHLNAGKDLSINELKAALLQSMTELHWANLTINNVRLWFDNVLSAHADRDDMKLKSMVEEIAKTPNRFPGEPVGLRH